MLNQSADQIEVWHHERQREQIKAMGFGGGIAVTRYGTGYLNLP